MSLFIFVGEGLWERGGWGWICFRCRDCGGWDKGGILEHMRILMERACGRDERGDVGELNSIGVFQGLL